MHRLSLLLAGLALLAGCVPPLSPCDFWAQGVVGKISECPDLIYADEDGDGWATVIGEGAGNADTLPAMVTDFGDCDDGDANRFPDNREVCDGLDNDCDPTTAFNEEEDELSEDEPACAPARTPRLYFAGGGQLNGQRVDGTTAFVSLAPGEELSGTVVLRALIPPEDLGSLAGLAVVNSDEANQNNFAALWDPLEAALPQPEESIVTVALDLDNALPPAPVETTRLLILAISARTGAPFLASLTNQDYCCEDGDCDAKPGALPTCQPSWDEQLAGATQGSDLADLDALDLGACFAYGAARVNELAYATTPQGDACSLGPSTPPCIPRFEGKDIGCQFIELHYEEGE